MKAIAGVAVAVADSSQHEIPVTARDGAMEGSLIVQNLETGENR